jgi:hypothetical protein
MTIGMPDDTQRTAARVVGAAYLIALVPAVFAEFYVRGQLVAVDKSPREICAVYLCIRGFAARPCHLQGLLEIRIEISFFSGASDKDIPKACASEMLETALPCPCRLKGSHRWGEMSDERDTEAARLLGNRKVRVPR